MCQAPCQKLFTYNIVCNLPRFQLLVNMELDTLLSSPILNLMTDHLNTFDSPYTSIFLSYPLSKTQLVAVIIYFLCFYKPGISFLPEKTHTTTNSYSSNVALPCLFDLFLVSSSLVPFRSYSIFHDSHYFHSQQMIRGPFHHRN